MPRIPQFVATKTASGFVQSGGPVRGVDLSSVVNAANQITATQEMLARKQDEEAKRTAHNEAVVHVANTMSETDITWREKLKERQMSGDADGMTESVLKDYDADIKARIESAPMAAKQSLRTEFARMRSSLHAQAFNIEVQARQAKALQQDDAGLDADSRAVLRDPSLFTDKLGLRQASAASLQVPENVRQARMSAARDKLVLAAATGYAQQNPHETLRALGMEAPPASSIPSAADDFAAVSAAQETPEARAQQLAILEAEANNPAYSAQERAAVSREIERVKARPIRNPGEAPKASPGEGHPALGMLPFERVDDIARIARATLERDVSSLRGSLRDKARDVQAAVASGLPVGDAAVDGVADQYITAYGAAEGLRRYRDEIGVPLQIGKSIGALRTGSAADRIALIQSANPVNQPAKHVSVDGTAEQKAQYDALVQANQIIERQLKEDPATYALQNSRAVNDAYSAMVAAEGDARPAAVAAYVTATRAEQERLGAPNVRLLTEAQGQAVVKAFMDNPPEAAGDVIAGLEDEWGKAWPAVYKQLSQENKLTPAALVIPNMKDQGARARMAQASAIKADDLKTMLDPADAKDLRAKLQDQFKPAAQTFLAQSTAGLQSVATIMDQAERLAFVYRSKGKGVAEAAKQAFDEVMGWRYEFTDTYRVPREEQAPLVTVGARAALEDVGRTKLFTSRFAMGQRNREEQTLDAIRAGGFWATNEDETGLVLKVKGADNNDYTVERPDGKPVSYTWQALRRLASDAQDTTARGVEAVKAHEMNQDQKRRAAEEEARLRRLRDMGLR